MTNIGNLIDIGFLFNEVDDFGSVIGSHLFPREVPVLLLVLGKLCVAIRESISSVVAYPNIIASSG
jgi:hypothetical protein